MHNSRTLKERIFKLLPTVFQNAWYRRNPPGAEPFVWLFFERRILYVEVPKVATRSIRNALGHWELPDVPVGSRAGKLGARIFGRRMTVREIASLGGQAYRFAFVRNPLNRLLSCYRDKIGARDPDKSVQLGSFRRAYRAYGVRAEMPFSEFVEKITLIPDNEADGHIRSQHRFLTYEGELVLDFVGRFETLCADWTILRERFGFPPLPHANPSPAGVEPGHPYSLDVARLAAERYSRDIELFGYSEEVERFISSIPAE